MQKKENETERKDEWELLSEEFTSPLEIPASPEDIQKYLDERQDANSSSEQELCYEIREILDSLSRLQRLCFEFHYYDGLLQNEIAEKLGIDRSTVFVHLERAREKIRESYGPVDYFINQVECFSETMEIRLYNEGQNYQNHQN